MKKEIKIGDQIRCGSYTDMMFKAEYLKEQGYVFRFIDERPDPAKRPKLHIEVVGKEEGKRRGHLIMERKSG